MPLFRRTRAPCLPPREAKRRLAVAYCGGRHALARHPCLDARRSRPAARRRGAGIPRHGRPDGARRPAGRGDRRPGHGRARHGRPGRRCPGGTARPLVGAPVGGAPYGGGAVVVSPGQQLQGGYIITPQNSWGTGVVTPGNPPTYIVPNNAGGTAIVTPGYGGPTLIRPNPVGGTTIIGPNQGTTVIAPTGRGGARHRRAGWNGVRRADAAGDLHPATGLRAAGGDLQALTLSRLRRAARIADRARKR